MAEEHVIHSPIPGIFYRRPSPDEDEFVQEGDAVESGAVIGLVEVMKQFHEIVADAAGTVGTFLVENEGTVDAGQPIVPLAT
jgi:acetyl-CoA carboxylase biotin carboxyl carrier protein